MPAQGEVKNRRVQPQRVAWQPGVVVRHLLEQEGRQHRDDGKREDERTAQREYDRHRHRHEELAFETLQRHQRQEDDGDDQDAGGDRRGHLTHRTKHHVLTRQLVLAVMSHVLDDVLDHHHRAVNQHAQRDS